MQLDLGAVAALHPLDHHVDVDLGQPGDDLLARLGVAMDIQRRILLTKPPDRRHRLLLVAAALRLEREGHDRARQLEARQLEVALAIAEQVPGAGLLQLRNDPDVAGAELVDRRHLPAPVAEELADALVDAAGHVLDLRFGCQRARQHPDHVQPSRERVGGRLEDLDDQLALLVGRHLDRLAVAVDQGSRPPHRRRGEVLDERLEQPGGAEVPGCDPACHREEVSLGDPALQRRDDLRMGVSAPSR